MVNLLRTAYQSYLKDIIHNVHVVQPNTCYRSRQLSAKSLEYYINKLGIKTIINLRGACPSAQWWRDEQAIAQRHNICLYNIAMSASQVTSQAVINQLLDAFDAAPLPILIHCRGGSDRTGEAAALWVLEKMGGNKLHAYKQLSLKYGHIKIISPHKTRFIAWWPGRKNFIQNSNLL